MLITRPGPRKPLPKPRGPRASRRPLPDLVPLRVRHRRHVGTVVLVLRRHAAVGIARCGRLQRVVEKGVDALAEVFGFVLRGGWC